MQEKEIEKVGDQKPIKISVRVISATHRDLKQLVQKDEFRDDLFYRLNVIPINIPPLRERKEDLPLLVETFISELQVKTNRPIKGISREAMEAMRAYAWPGNIRELINALEYAFVTCSGMVIDISNLRICPALCFGRLLDPEVRLWIVVEPETLQIRDGFSDVFVFDPSLQLRQRLKQLGFRIEAIEESDNLWRVHRQQELPIMKP